MFSRLRSKHPGSSLPHLLFYELIRRLASLTLRILYRYRAYDVRNLPDSGPVLIVANHQSFLDPQLIAVSITRRHIEFVARMGLFSHGLFGRLISALNSLPIKEEGGDTAAIKDILRRLDAGRAVLIFPEGSRSDTGQMSPFKRGVAVLVKRSRCPVIPVAVEGCFDAWPNSRKLPRLFGCRIAVAFGQPIPHEQLMAEGMDLALDHLAAEVDRMRLDLRAKLRQKTRGRLPRPGPGDLPISTPSALDASMPPASMPSSSGTSGRA